ncbi:hypothetical protein [Brevundimonas sp.]|uniref:hypothetical protein n=1 Tax=Brevundimonas sp. TaxID=1871086 RepID=UPI001D9FC1BB|nr:hypothetical protein [Brevundimonas sp.]MBL0946842.1 hypothetical protein [Brevundimonas sp.]
MSLDKKTIKAAAVALLDGLGEVHPMGHQDSKARRYVLRADGGTPLEIMFEQDPKSSANLWVHARAAGSLATKGKNKPASALWTKIGKDGAPLYGRHSALEKMPQLGSADLICFVPETLTDLGAILDQVLSASAARITI